MIATPLKHVARANGFTLSQGTDPSLQFLYCDVSSVERGKLSIPETKIAFADAPSRARRIASSGDVVMSTVRPYLRAVAQVPEETDTLVFSTGFAVLSPRADQITSRYLYWAMQSDPFVAEATRWSNGVSYPAINADDLLRIKLPLPPREQQERLASYLDVETAKIDRLITKQRELLDLLVERETARRNRLLDGVDGKRIRLRWLLSPSRVRAIGDEKVLSVYRDYGVIPKSSRSDNFNKTPEDLSNYLVVRVGDLVVNKMKAWQGSLGVSEFDGIVSGDYEVLRPSTNDLNLEFLHYLLRSRRFVNEYALRSKGVRPSQWRLYWQELAEIEIPLPPLAEQRGIVAAIDESRANEAALDAGERMIELLQERRSALITAAVTGQIEV